MAAIADPHIAAKAAPTINKLVFKQLLRDVVGWPLGVEPGLSAGRWVSPRSVIFNRQALGIMCSGI